MRFEVPLPTQRLNNAAKLPTRGTEMAAGLDLYAAEDITISGRGKGLIGSGIAVAIPEGHYGRIAPRSGFSWKNHCDIGAGVIDSDFRGEIKILVFNHKRDDLRVRCGDRIAQLILEKISYGRVLETNELPPTRRNAGGFGSTGES
jgi:dUTP pyrophosphatase